MRVDSARQISITGIAFLHTWGQNSLSDHVEQCQDCSGRAGSIRRRSVEDGLDHVLARGYTS